MNNVPKDSRIIKEIRKNYVLYLFILPSAVYIILFNYVPIYGVQIAFKNFMANKGIWGSPWVGFKNFNDLFSSPIFFSLLKNTIVLSIYSLVVGVPLPIILAIMLNYTNNRFFKKLVQNATYAPHFISTVVMVGMVILFLSPTTGIVNILIKALGGEPYNFMQSETLFPSIYVWSGACLLALVFLLVAYQLYFVVIASMSDYIALNSGKVIFAPVGFNLDCYIKLFENTKIWVGYRNSIIYTICGTAINVTLTMLTGYALSRKDLAGRKYIMLFFLFTMFFNGGLIPFMSTSMQSVAEDIESLIERQKYAELVKYGSIIVSSLPVLILYPFIQKYFVKGVMIGAIKG